MKKYIFISFILISTFAFAQADEKIAGFSITMDQMVFTVWNTGYTDKTAFALDIKKVGSVYEVKLIRTRHDYGKMMPQPMEIIFSQEELKGKLDLKSYIRIVNTFSILNF